MNIKTANNRRRLKQKKHFYTVLDLPAHNKDFARGTLYVKCGFTKHDPYGRRYYGYHRYRWTPKHYSIYYGLEGPIRYGGWVQQEYVREWWREVQEKGMV